MGLCEDSFMTDRPPILKHAPIHSFGAVEGRVQTRTSDQSLHFALLDAIHSETVSCWVVDGHEEFLIGIEDQRVIVEGVVERESLTGRPTTVRGIERITPLGEVPAGTYRLARGAAPPPPDALSPEEAVRRVRDA